MSNLDWLLIGLALLGWWMAGHFRGRYLVAQDKAQHWFTAYNSAEQDARHRQRGEIFATELDKIPDGVKLTDADVDRVMSAVFPEKWPQRRRVKS